MADSCVEPRTLMQIIFMRPPTTRHVLKCVSKETLDEVKAYTPCPPGIETIYVIAKHQVCLRCGGKFVTQTRDYFPAESSINNPVKS